MDKNLTRRQFINKAGLAASGAAVGTSFIPAIANASSIFDLKNVESGMKWCLYTYTLTGSNKIPPADLDIEDMCKRTKALGIDAIDIIGVGYNKTWKEMKVIADSYDLKFVCYTKGVRPMESPDATTRKAGLKDFRKNLAIAKTLGSSRIMMNQGGLSTNPDQNRKFLIESLKEALPIAKSEGIEVTIETHNNPKAPFRTSANFTEAIAILPDLRVTFDSGNDYKNGEDPIQGFINNQEHITHMHFKDFFKDGGGTCTPGIGIIDFPGLIDAMKKANYSGYINIEMGGKSPSGWEVYKKSLEILGPLI